MFIASEIPRNGFVARQKPPDDVFRRSVGANQTVEFCYTHSSPEKASSGLQATVSACLGFAPPLRPHLDNIDVIRGT
ncbi:unnamed protein product [Caenorhabditis auriculariae]|uniref:Uncharacterized protein n=1 Tax=Caenorhabditis auriculariae TaxID=2777116 RepID=A0A8S1HRD3_9PELO|nr:unnamed protein product [Caenorhabditis auriculariae]